MLIYLLFGVALALLNITLKFTTEFPWVEPLYLVFYIFLTLKRPSHSWVNLGAIFALGQLIVTISNARLGTSVLDGFAGGMYNYIIPAYIPEAYCIHFAGVALLLLGYHSFNLNVNWIRSESKSDRSGTLTIFAICLVINDYFIHLALPGSLNSLLKLFPIATVLFLSRRAYTENSIRVRSYAILLMIFQIITAFLFEMLRIHMVLPVLAFFIGIFLAKPKLSFFISPRFYPYYLGLVLFVSFFFAFGAVRGTTWGTDRIKAISHAQQEFADTKMSTTHGPFERMADLAQITNVVDLKLSNKVKTGETLQILTIALVPRILWPSKPIIALGVWFAVKIGKALETESGWFNTSINMTISGHLWMEFGWLGLILGMFIIGLLYNILWSACGKLQHPNNLLGTLFGCYLIISSITGFGADLQIVISTIALFLIVIVLSSILKLASNYKLTN